MQPVFYLKVVAEFLVSIQLQSCKYLKNKPYFYTLRTNLQSGYHKQCTSNFKDIFFFQIYSLRYLVFSDGFSNEKMYLLLLWDGSIMTLHICIMFHYVAFSVEEPMHILIGRSRANSSAELLVQLYCASWMCFVEVPLRKSDLSFLFFQIFWYQRFTC